MKRMILLFVVAMVTATTVWADKKVKRPETYNYQRAREAIDNEEYDEALEYLQKELQENPKNGYAYNWVAYIYASRDEDGKALENVNKALKYLPAKDKELTGFAHGLRAGIYLALNDTQRGLDDLGQAIRLCPDDNQYLEKRAETYWEMNRYEESNADYQSLIDRDESSYMGHMGLGRNLKDQERWDEAIGHFNQVIRMYSDQSQPFAFLAECQIGKKMWKESSDNIVKALEIDQSNKAFGLMQTKDKTFATLLLAKLKGKLNKEPDDPSWPYNIAVVHECQKQYAKAIGMYKKAQELSPSDIVLKRISDCYGYLGMQTEALTFIEQAIAMDSTDTELLQSKAYIQYESRDMEGAIATITRFIEREPDFYGGYYSRGFFYDNMGRVDESIEDYTMAITLDSTFAYSFLGRADQYMKKGMRKEAMADYRRVTLRDTVPSANSCAFYAFLALGQQDKAVAFLDSYLNKFPEDAGTRYDACCLHARMGEAEKALGYLRRAFELGYRRFAHIELDDDVDSLRELPAFKALMEEYKAKFAQEQEIQSTENAEAANVGPMHEETTEIPFTRGQSNTCSVKCSINELPLTFVFDTGASTVSISQVEATFMLKNGYLSKNDVVGKTYFSDANGNVNEGTVLNLKNVNFGGIELKNVKASVVRNQKAPLLLGQSVFQQLGRIEIDNEKRVLKVTRMVKGNS